ncbi:MAG: outer membrane beta-barrel protein [Pseudolabrys sp.]
MFAALLLAGLLVDSVPQYAYGQVILPNSPAETPPWSSLQVFDPVWFARFWSRDANEAVAPEDTPVKTRVQPGFESVGIRAGSWMFSPAITAGSFYDSNVFASSADKHGDLAGVVEPSLGISSLWDRHALNIGASVRSIDYRSFSGLNQTDANLQMRGRIDVWHDAAILTSFRLASLHEGVGSLTSPAGAAEPTPYTFASADVSYWQQFNRLATSFGVRADSYDYGSTRAQDGTIINQDSRDGHVHVAHGRVDYAISPDFGVFSSFEANRRDLRGTPTQPLSSDGYRSLTGIDVQLTHLIMSEIAAGYASQRFDDPGIGTIAGPSYRASLHWSPTRMLDLHVQAEQIVTEAADTVASGIRANAFQIGADYELRRDTVLSVSGTYERDKFFGQSREDTVYATEAALKHLFNRYIYISARYRYLRRDSSAPSSSYDKHEVALNVTAHY